MQSRLPVALTVLALIGAGAAFNAKAQQPPPGPPPIPPRMEAHDPHREFSPSDRAAFFDARVAALHAGLKLTPDQEKLWPPIEAALRAGEKSREERHAKTPPEHPDIIARLREISEGEIAHGVALKAIADAASPLYASLSEDQKHRLPLLLHAIRPHFGGPHGMGGHPGMDGHPGMGGHGEMGRHGEMMHEGWRGGDHPEGFDSHGDGPGDHDEE